MLVGFGHGGLKGLEEEGEALVGGVGTAGGELKGSKTVEDGAEPGDGGVGAEAREVGPDEGEVGKGAEGGAGPMVGGFGGVAVAVDP